MTAPGPLARKLAEGEAEAAKDRDALATMVRIHDRLLNAMYEALGLDPDDDETCVPDCEEGPQGSDHYLWHIVQQRDDLRADVEVLRAEARAAYNRAVRWATALTRQTEMTGHQHDDTCVAEACAAAVWLEEVGQG